MDDLQSRTRRSYALAQETPVLRDILPPPRVQGRGASLSPLRQPFVPSSSQNQTHGSRDFYSPPRRPGPSSYGQVPTQNEPALRSGLPQPQSKHSQVSGSVYPQTGVGGLSPYRQRFPLRTGLLGKLVESKDARVGKNIATVHSPREGARRTSPSRIPLSKVSLMSNIDENVPETLAYNRPSPSSGISAVSTFKRQKTSEFPSKGPPTENQPQSQSFRSSPISKIAHQRGVSPSRIPIKGLAASTAVQTQVSRSHTPGDDDGNQRGRSNITQSVSTVQNPNIPAKRVVPRGVSPSRIPRSTSKKELREDKSDVISPSMDYSRSQDVPSTDTSLVTVSPEELPHKNTSLSRGTSPSRIPTSLRRKKQQAAAAKSPDASYIANEPRLSRRQSKSPSPSPDRAIHRSRKSEFVKPSTPSPKNVLETSNKEAKDERRHYDKVPRGISPSRIPIKRQMKDSDMVQISSQIHPISPIKVSPLSTSGKSLPREIRFAPEYHETDIDSTISANIPKLRDETVETPLKGFPVPIPREMSRASSGSESSLGILDLPRQDSNTSLISFKNPFDQNRAPEPPSPNRNKLGSSSPIHPRSHAPPDTRVNLSVYNPIVPKVSETKKIRPYSPKKSMNILHCQFNAEPPKPLDSPSDDRKRRMYKSLENLNKLKKSAESNIMRMPPRTLTSISLSGLRHAQNLLEYEVPSAEAVNDYPPPYTPPSPPDTLSYASPENSPPNTPLNQEKQAQLQEASSKSHEVGSSSKHYGAPPRGNYFKSDISSGQNFGQQNSRRSKSSDNLNILLNATQPADNKYALSPGKKFPSSVDDLIDFGNESSDSKFNDSYKQDLRLADALMNAKNYNRNGFKSQETGPASRFQDKRSLSQNDFYYPVKSVGETINRKDLARSDEEAVRTLILGQQRPLQSGVSNDRNEPLRTSSEQTTTFLPPEQRGKQPERFRNIATYSPSYGSPGTLSNSEKVSTSQPQLFADNNQRLKQEWLKHGDQWQVKNKEIPELNPRWPWGGSSSLEQIHRHPPQYNQSQGPDRHEELSYMHAKQPQSSYKGAEHLKLYAMEGRRNEPSTNQMSDQNETKHGLYQTRPLSFDDQQNQPLLMDALHSVGQLQRLLGTAQSQLPSTSLEQQKKMPVLQSEQTQPRTGDSCALPMHSSGFSLSDADQVAFVDLQCSSNSSPNNDYRVSGKVAFIRSNSGSDIKNRGSENPDETFLHKNDFKSAPYRRGAAGADSDAFDGQDSALNVSTSIAAAAAALDKAPSVPQSHRVNSQNIPLAARVELTNGFDEQHLPLSGVSPEPASVGVVNSAYESDEFNETEDAVKVFSGPSEDIDKDNILLLSQLKSLENDQCQKLGIENTGFNYVSDRKLSDSVNNNSLSSEPRGLSSKLVSDYSSHETLDSIHHIANQLTPGVKFVSPKKLSAIKRVNSRQRTRHAEKDTVVSSSSDSEGGFTNARGVPASLIQPKNDPKLIYNYSNSDDLKNNRHRTGSGGMEGRGNETPSLEPVPNKVEDSNGGTTNTSFHDEGFVSPTQDYLSTTGSENLENLKPNEDSEEKLSQLQSKTRSPMRSKNPAPDMVEDSQDLSRMRLNFLKDSKPSAKPPTHRDSRVQSYNARPLAQNEQLLSRRGKSNRSFGKKTNVQEVQKQQTPPATNNLENGIENGSAGRKRPSALGSFRFRTKKSPSISTDVESQGGGPEDRTSRTSIISRTSSGPVITRTYWTRFYILAVFSLVAMMQCIVWGTWGPITESAITALQWSEGTMSLLSSWGPITIILFIVPVAWFNQRFGLRVGVTLATTLVLAGTLLRCIPVEGISFTVLANMCAISTGIGGCLTLSLPAMVAATWFPPRERTTATAVAALFSQFGSALIYLEPLIVRTSDIAGNKTKTCEASSATARSRRAKREAIRLPDAVDKVKSRVIRQTHTTFNWNSPPSGELNHDSSNTSPQYHHTTQSSRFTSSGIYGRPPNVQDDPFASGSQRLTPNGLYFNPDFMSSDGVQDIGNSSNFASTNPYSSRSPDAPMDPTETENTIASTYPNHSKSQSSPGHEGEDTIFPPSSRNPNDRTLFGGSAFPAAGLNSTNSEKFKPKTHPNSFDNDTAPINYANHPFSTTRDGNWTSRGDNGYGSSSDPYGRTHFGSQGGTEPMSNNGKINMNDAAANGTTEHPGVGATDDAKDPGRSRARSDMHEEEPESRMVSYDSNVTPKNIQDDILNLMYIQAGMAGVMFVVVVAYFPATPPHPPSLSSAAERLNYFAGIKTMLKSPQMVLLIVTYAFSVGIPIVWVALMNFSLCCIGIDQEESMNVALAAILTSCGTAFIAARITDLIFGYLKRTIIVLLALASICFLWFLLISVEVIAPSLVQVYLSVTGGVALQYATVPLLTELAVEIAFPCPESVVGVMIIGSFNIVAAVFLLLLMIPSDCYIWVNGVLVACTSLTIVPLIFVKETHGRRATDMVGGQPDGSQGHDNLMEEYPETKALPSSEESPADTATLSQDGNEGADGHRNLGIYLGSVSELSADNHNTEL